MRVCCEFECDGSCEKCPWCDKEVGCLQRPCNRNKLKEIINNM